ncbi:MAG TPA: phytanoyl-CoA dioxygenase family protein [Abditibacteriaceae bacterium]|nr:phytanoyl-CoA dioxygenase family protein [Abditibacteriaceae bacterium]
MSFEFTEQHITDYYHHGYTIFRSVLPPRLIEELRAAGEELHEISRQQRGPNVARSPVLGAVTEQLSQQSLQAFHDYRELPELVQSLHGVLGPEHMIDVNSIAAFFIYPLHPHCQDWHRDIDEGYKGITESGDREEFRRLKQDPTFFVQVNCALYTDTCLWYVPGSAGRPNTGGELAAAGAPYIGIEGRGKLLDQELEGKSYAEQERIGIEYCRAMPAAVNVVLEAGDFCLYRPIGWHTGHYAPHRKRLTLHHHVTTSTSRAWYAGWSKRLAV